MRKAWFAVILAASLSLVLVGNVSQAFATWRPQQVFSTQKADIWYRDSAELQELASRLGIAGDVAPGQPGWALLATQIGGMLEEVSRVLQKWPLRPVKLQIRLFANGVQVQQQLQALRRFPKTHVMAGRVLSDLNSMESFYDPQSRTIYMSLADFRRGILAHEMTHFILCEGHTTWPSATFQESLAQYVERRFNTGPQGVIPGVR